MPKLVVQALREINKLPVLTVQPKLGSGSEVDLLHPDGYVAGTEVTLHDLLSDFNTRRHFLGKRLAGMTTGASYYPLSFKHRKSAGETDEICIVGADGAHRACDVDLHDSKPLRFFTCNYSFAVVDIAELPPIGASHFISAVVDDDAAVLVAIDEPVTVRVMPSLMQEVTVDSFTAAIIPPGPPIFMQGARSMLIRPVLV